MDVVGMHEGMVYCQDKFHSPFLANQSPAYKLNMCAAPLFPHQGVCHTSQAQVGERAGARTALPRQCPRKPLLGGLGGEPHSELRARGPISLQVNACVLCTSSYFHSLVNKSVYSPNS